MHTGTHVETVLGPIPATDLGFTLPHEHTYTASWLLPERFDYAGIDVEEAVLVEELMAFRRAGGSCLVDVTPKDLGRRPLAVRALALRTGLHIVLGTGYYRDQFYPPEARIDRRSVESIADELVGEIVEGIGDTGIRPGIIGEIGVSKTWVSAQEERVHRAVGRAQAATGLAVTTHGLLSDVGLSQLRLFVAEGADPRKVVIGHCDWYPRLAFCLEVVAAGACVEFDLLGNGTAYSRGVRPQVLALILELAHRGHAEHVLVSQDVWTAERLRAFGGSGYTFVHDDLLPALRAEGADQQLIDQLTIANPRRLLGIDRRP